MLEYHAALARSHTKVRQQGHELSAREPHLLGLTHTQADLLLPPIVQQARAHSSLPGAVLSQVDAVADSGLRKTVTAE